MKKILLFYLMSFKSAELTSGRNLVCTDHQEYCILVSPPVVISCLCRS